MEVLLLLAIILAAIIIINTLGSKISETHFRFDALNHELQKVRKDLEALREQTAGAAPQVTEIKTEPPKPTTTVRAPEFPIPPVIIPVPIQPPIAKTPPAEPKIREENREEKPEPGNEETVPKPSGKVSLAPEPEEIFEPVYAETKEEYSGGFFEKFLHNNPDLEKFIGENLINKIGIAILVLGIGYFVKFAIDKDWINEIGRVAIGIVAGGILIGVAHRMRHTFNAFSSVLVGGGLAVLYFTIAIAFHEYQLFSQTAAFLIMAVITAFSVLLAVSYNRMELAVLSLLGGFATPFMVSTGEGNYQVLFTYILILNVGMLVLAYLKNWKIINWITYGFTILLYGGWLSSKVLNNPNGPFLGALVFATLFYVVFFMMNIVNNLKQKARFTTPEISILLSNTFFFYSAGMLVLHEIRGGLYQGLFTVSVAVFNFIFAFVLFRNQKADRNLIYLLTGLVITFISLAIPVQLEGNYITLFWALEAVLLLWFAQRTGLKLIVVSSLIVSGLMLISLLMDWSAIYVHFPAGTNYRILLNKGFVTSVVAALSLGASMWLLKKHPETISLRHYDFEPLIFHRLFSFILVIVVYASMLLELDYQLGVYVSSFYSRAIILGTYNLAFMAALFGLKRFTEKAYVLNLILALAALGITLYALVYNPAVHKLLKAYFLENQPGFVGFPFHYLNLALTALLIYLIARNRNLIDSFWPSAPKYLLWILAFLVVYFASSELLFHVLYFNNPPANPEGLRGDLYTAYLHENFSFLTRQTYKVGFPILWGICAFVFMYLGLQRKNKHLRIISLSLFSITLLKLFLFDIRGISEGGKIAAFIFLGLLLLVISFMYQKIKTLLLTDEKVTDPGENL